MVKGHSLRSKNLVALASFTLAGCGESGTVPFDGSQEEDRTGRLTCSIATSEVFDGGPGKDGIPALTNPPLAPPGAERTEYLRDDDRVIGFAVGDESVAVPLNILWWHEVVNLDLGGGRYALTHCPLTGSSIAFDRSAAAHAEFGVSGLLYRNNLVMYDRSEDESLWPQMLAGARCGSRDGRELPILPSIESTWAAWRSMHPDTRVLTEDTGYARDYRIYPYGDYDRIDNPQTLFPTRTTDDRRPPKERALGIVSGEGGVLFPFGMLDEGGPRTVVKATVDGELVTVLWDRQAEAAMAYRSGPDGAPIDLAVGGGRFVDRGTGSVWRVDGLAVDGPLAGSRLDPVAEAYVAYWFAWIDFFPDIDVWRPI